MFRLKPVYFFLLLAIFLTSCDNKTTTAISTNPTVAPAETEAITPEPTAEITTEPTAEVTNEPTSEVTSEPTSEVISEPTKEITSEPTADVTSEPTKEVTTEPTQEVTSEPTQEVTNEPTQEVTNEPTQEVTPPVEVTENCAISIGGQSFYISGGTGGLTTKQNGYEVSWDDVNTVINDAIKQTPQDVRNDVAILIVDDFTGEIPSDVLGQELTEDDLITHKISHGMMVYEHTVNVLNNLLEGLYSSKYTLTLPVPPGNPGTDMAVFEFTTSTGTHRIIVQQVASADAKGGYNTGIIEQNVRGAIKVLSGMNISRFVVNMSFIILPCPTIQGFEQNVTQGISFDKYVEDLITNNPDPSIKDFGDWIKNQVNKLAPNDPLLGYIQEVGSSGTIIFIAAAGNYGAKISSPSGFWFYPGAWDEVINVSGEQLGGSTEGSGGGASAWGWWQYSNLGDVMLPAAWYQYKTISGQPSPKTIYYYAGTSFAAPVMSVITAIYSGRTDPKTPESCPFDGVPLRFANLRATNPVDVPNFERVRQILKCKP